MNIKNDVNNFISEQMKRVNYKYDKKYFFSLVLIACCMEKQCLFVSRQWAGCVRRVSPLASSIKTAYQS